MLQLVLCVLATLDEGSSTTYFVKPDHEYYPNKNAHTLSYYLMNSNKYFSSYTQLQFLPGISLLKSDLILQDVKNFTLCGNASVIQCNGLAITVGIINVTNLMICNIHFDNCGKRDSRVFKDNHETLPYNHSGVLYLNHCSTVKISRVIITANPDVSGIVVVNVFGTEVSSFIDVRIVTSCGYPNGSSSPVNGIEFYYNDISNGKHLLKTYFITKIRCYIYENNGLCNSSYALFLVLIQESYGISMVVQDTNFTQLYNSSVLYYHAESCGKIIDNVLSFNHCSISHNLGNSFVNLFHILVHSDGYFYSRNRNQSTCDTQFNVIGFDNCYFINNSNMNSLLYFDLKGTLLVNANVIISNSNLCYNYKVQIIKVNSEVKILWQLSHYIRIVETNMSSNAHPNMVSMLLSTNGLIELSNSVFKNNTYESIIQQHLSILRFEFYTEFSFNFARFILRAEEGSYYLLREYTTINITRNLVYAGTVVTPVYNEYLDKICYYQFVSYRGNLDHEFAVNKTLNYKILYANNTYTAPQVHVRSSSSDDCSWLAGTAFDSSKSSKVFSTIIERSILWANKTIRESVMSIVCPCSTENKFDCMDRHLGSLFPGQTLTVKLIMHSTTTTMIAYTSKSKRGCIITDILEISQTHSSHTCNVYNYTIWSNHHECELYLGPDGTPEVFYVTLKPCPPGFTRQKKQKSCYCDSVLKSFTTSCKLQDQTVLRRPKSWISGKSFNRSHIYSLSHDCPFDYCLPYPSYVNPSTPDQQCRFKRSGVLCGHCQPGLSAVFGSSHCKQCSNVYLWIVIPIAIAGIALVVMIFSFNLTVTNGVINTFIFYVNIISINISVFFPKCHSVCVLLALSNLDLGLETCFYNGMDTFSKTFLQLAFPLYLILIAFALIIGSRYSIKIQRLTAQRALPVLATLFLLIYTKILLTVCSVLFFFSPITHLPSDHITFVWSVDTSIPLFGIKFSILFAVCLVLFLILLPFNILLLFPRTLSRFHLINTFKPLLDAYLGPYKDRFAYWMGLQLLIRAIFLGLSALNTDESLTIGTFILGAILCVEGFVHPFKSRFKNIQESLTLLNLLAVYVTASHYDGSTDIEPLLLQCLIFTTFAYFITYIACHCMMSTCGNTIKPKIDVIMMHFNSLKKRIINQTSTEMLNVTVSERSEGPGPGVVCSNYEEFQESLITFND